MAWRESTDRDLRNLWTVQGVQSSHGLLTMSLLPTGGNRRKDPLIKSFHSSEYPWLSLAPANVVYNGVTLLRARVSATGIVEVDDA